MSRLHWRHHVEIQYDTNVNDMGIRSRKARPPAYRNSS